jgi:predicted esterase
MNLIFNRSANLFGVISWIVSVLIGSAQSPEVPPVPPPLPEGVEVFTIRTDAELNRRIPFYVRVPKNYQPGLRGKTYRMLFLCPVLNHDGLEHMNNSASWYKIADERQWFVMTCTFTQKVEDAHNRRFSYYYPDTSFSGKAMLEALDQVSKKYPIDTERLLMQGLSGGGQFVHRFAMWAPERVSAVAVNSCSWFDKPSKGCNQVAWFVTVGESDGAYNNSLEVVDQLKAVGAFPLFRSYPGLSHEINSEVITLNMNFLQFYDDHTKKDLGEKRPSFISEKERLSLQGDKMPFVGDSQDWKYWPNTAYAREGIAKESMIYLPNEEVAKVWGVKGEEE